MKNANLERARPMRHERSATGVGHGDHGPRHLLFLLAAVALSMLLGAGVWALPTQNPLRATVPTRTPTLPPPTDVPPTEVPPTQAPPTEAPTQAPATSEPTKEKDAKKEPTQAPTATDVPPTPAAAAQVLATATTDPVTTVQQFPKTGADVAPMALGALGGACLLGLAAWRALRRRASGPQ